MASPAGRGAQVRLDGDAQKAARGGLGGTLIATLEAKRLLEISGASSDGTTLDGSTRTGVAAEDEVLAPGGALVGGGGGAVTFGSTAGTVAQGNDPRIVGALSATEAAATYAPKASPTFTGTPTAPSPPAGSLTLQIATALWVRQEIAALVNSAPGTLDTLGELATALAGNPDFATTVTTALAQQAARLTTLDTEVAALQAGGGAATSPYIEAGYVDATYFVDAAVGTGTGSGSVAGGQFTSPAQARSYIGIPRIDVKSTYGGFFDAGSHPLGSSYSSLAAAQAAFPNAGITTLADEADWAAMQQAIYDAAHGVGGVIGLHTGAQMIMGTKSLDIIAGNIVFLRGGPNVGIRCANLPAGVPALIIRGVQPHEHKTSVEDISFYARNTGSFGFAPIENDGGGHTQYTAGSIAISMYDCFQVSLHRVTFNGFDRPVLNGDNLWSVLFDKCVYCNNNLGASWARTVPVNSGEQIRWRDCGLNNNNWGFYLEPHILDANGGASLGGSFFFDGGSMDYNQRGHGYYDGGANGFDTNNILTLTNMHLETMSSVSGATPRIRMTGGSLAMFGNLAFENGTNTTPGLVQVSSISRARGYGNTLKGGKAFWPMFYAPSGQHTEFVAGQGNYTPDGVYPLLYTSADRGSMIDTGWTAGGFGASVGSNTGVDLRWPKGIVRLTANIATTLTVPDDSEFRLMDGGEIEFLTLGTGVHTFVGNSGVTVSGAASLGGQAGKRAKLIKTGLNAWYLAT